MPEKCNSIANALELHLSCTNPSISSSLYWNGTLHGIQYLTPMLSRCWSDFWCIFINTFEENVSLQAWKVSNNNKWSQNIGKHNISRPPAHPYFAWAIKLTVHAKITLTHFQGFSIKSGILHILNFHLHTLSCHFWLNLWKQTWL